MPNAHDDSTSGKKWKNFWGFRSTNAFASICCIYVFISGGPDLNSWSVSIEKCSQCQYVDFPPIFLWTNSDDSEAEQYLCGFRHEELSRWKTELDSYMHLYFIPVSLNSESFRVLLCFQRFFQVVWINIITLEGCMLDAWWYPLITMLKIIHNLMEIICLIMLFNRSFWKLQNEIEQLIGLRLSSQDNLRFNFICHQLSFILIQVPPLFPGYATPCTFFLNLCLYWCCFFLLTPSSFLDKGTHSKSQPFSWVCPLFCIERAHHEVYKSVGSGVRLPVLKSQLRHLLTMILGWFLHLLVPQLPHLQNGKGQVLPHSLVLNMSETSTW